MSAARRSGSFPVEALVHCALFAALTAVCAQLIIPVGAVPVSLSLLPVLLCAALLPVKEAVFAMAGYILLGLAGAPVFSGFQGGAGKLFSATGGYILGYLPCAAVIGLMLRRFGHTWPVRALSMSCGVCVCYLFGTIWFMVLQGADPVSCLKICVLPFLPFDAAKITLAVILSGRLAGPLARMTRT